MDGGLNLDNIELAVESGANCIVAGSSIFKAKDRKEVITQMKAAFVKKEWGDDNWLNNKLEESGNSPKFIKQKKA